ncbi:MAG TPA: ATP-binding protein [Arthrobacter sp.]|jgi:serine/threonine-protein kinase RsbW|nr:ATP-binding protein [Arthrobacter sp.]
MAEFHTKTSRQGLATAETVDALHADFEALWAEADFVPELDRMAFSTAVIEAASNVVRHAVPSTDAPLQLGIDITVSPRRLEARICEIGAAPSDLKLDGPQTAAVGDEAESGRGLTLIRALVSTITFERQGEDNVWVLCPNSDGPHP